MRSSTAGEPARRERPAAGMRCAPTGCCRRRRRRWRRCCWRSGCGAARSTACALPERRGEQRHGAAAGPAGLAAWRQRRRTDQRPAADRAHPRARGHRAGHLRHRHLRRARRAAPAARRHPSIRAARRAALRAPLPRSLAARPRAVRGIRSVAEHDHRDLAARHSADPGQWPAVGTLVPALALSAAHDRRPAAAVRSLPGAHAGRRRALRRTRRAARRHHRQSQARRAGAAGRPAKLARA